MDRNFHSLACLSGSGSAASVSSWACKALADSPHALHFCFFSSKNSKGCALHRSGSSTEHALSVDPNAFGGKLNGSNANNTGTCQTNQPKTFKTSDFRICWTYIHGSFQGGLGRDLLPSPTQDLPRSIYHGFGETAWAERDAARLMVPSAPSSPRAPSVLEVPAGAVTNHRGHLLQRTLANWQIVEDLSFKHSNHHESSPVGELVKVKSFFPMSLDVMDSLRRVPCFSSCALGHLQAQTQLQNCYFSWAEHQAQQILTCQS